MNKRLEFRGGWGAAFIPVVIFLFFCILFFIVFKAFEMYALAMGAFVALMVGAIFVKKGNYNRFWDSVYEGVKEAVPITILLFVIGMFSELIKATNISSGFVWLANLLGVDGGLFTAFTFLAVCIISTATGSSIGTMFTCFPIFYPAGVLLGCDPAVLAGAIVSASIFGDNLAPISDTTIISAGTQEYTKKEGFAEVGGCVAARLKYSLVAGIISFVLFWVFGGGGTVGVGASDILAKNMNPTTLVMLVPVAVMLIAAIKTRNIYIAITIGIILGTITGLAFNLLNFDNIISVVDGAPKGFLTGGISSMMATVTLVISVYGIMGVLNGAGVLEKVTNGILNSKMGQTVRGAEIAMMLGISFTTLIFGGVTSASMTTFGKVQNEIGKRVGLHPYRRSYLLDGFANAIVLVIPFLSVFVFLGALLSKGYDFVSPLLLTQVSSGMIYCMVLFLVLLFSIITGWGREYEGLEGKAVSNPQE
ncbi:Na+/H+ antiporter family protein [Neobacillus bataviensis LMG 21833]|uniref:Na+/H+ antiporter family protein n=1 Tax=Neobacillus bataviensis LMG 21833 TaxID=1117379 RepID=K6D2C4_9BACI|nr:Na+/H+ antiporter NhaC family protein [Neobacillus bataviensis]EKN66632.1 Na+/H+ antiporter family protein [Neobacillus bataviensis LMG 21833]